MLCPKYFILELSFHSRLNSRRPSFHTRKLRHREVQGLAQGHTAGKGWTLILKFTGVGYSIHLHPGEGEGPHFASWDQWQGVQTPHLDIRESLFSFASSPHPLSPASSLQASIPPCSLSFLPSHYLISLDTSGLLQGAHPGYPPPRRELQGQEVGVGWLIHLRSPNIQERLKENLRGGPRSGRVHPCWKRALPHRDKPSPHLPPPPGGAGMQLQEGRIFVPWRFPGPGTASA